MAPSTFASAAASNNSTPSRTDSGDSSRRTNGATQTFRRTSLAASSNHASLREGSTASSNIYVPPHIASSRNGVPSEARYSREQLLDLLRQQQEAVNQAQDLSALFVGGWDGRDRNGANHVDHNVRGEGPNSLPQGAEICWELNGGLQPLGLSEMTEEEKELFTTSVNSPIKPSVQNTNKDGSARDGLSLRKSSITRDPSNPSAYGLTSPTAPRSGPRRREPSDSYPFPTNSTTTPTGGSKFFREDNNPAQPPPALLRRRTDFKEGTPTTEAESTERDKSQEEGTGQPTPVGTLKRSTTGPLSAGLSGPSSPWSATPQNTGFNPIGGAFGSFTLGASQATPTGENRPGFGSMRGQSRFKGLMSKETNEESNRNLAEKQSAGELGKINESSQTQARQPPSWTDARRERSFTTDTDEGARTGSAALGGAQDISPLQSHVAPINATPARGETRDDLSFSAFGMTPDHLPGGVRDMLHNRDQLQLLAQQQQSISALHEPMSPTDTNPYQSPETHPQDVDTDGSDIQTAHLPGLGNHVGEQGSLPGLSALGGFGGFGRTHMGPESDRSQTSSTGPNRQFPNIGGLGGLPGLGNATWGSSATMGTPLRERTSTHTFADNYLGTSAELQSPNLAGLGPGNLFGSGPGMSFGASSNVPRGGRLGSLFPTAMQDEMRSREDSIQHDENIIGEGRDRSLSGFGGAGPNRYDMGMGRESDSPFHAARGSLGDILGSGADAATTPLGQSQSQSQSGAPGAASSAFAQGPQQRASQQSDLRQGQGSGSSGSSQPPPAQQRTMVMPDRMRWIYRDPQGNTQGPWSGLEMHDWYKAGFFSPELLVKKYEDPDYEPLAQLIRRIGNSREPFLVPQIGIPHGPPGGGPSAWSGQSTVPNTQGTGTGQPPFASAFPSFGTTLTAEQQNALERRKQEEQYLMARQKEHLQAQHQYQRQMQMAGQHSVLPQQLQHHSSAHSLHSQPSFGSITSPSGYQQSPSQGQIQTAQGGPGFFDNSFRPGQATNAGPMAGGQDMLNRMKEQDMSGLLGRLNLGQGSQPPFGGQPSQFDQQDSTHAQQVAQMLNDRSRLQREQAEYESQQRFNQNEEQATAARLQQFQGLRGSQSQEPTASTEGMIRNLPGQLSEALQQRPQQEMDEEDDPVATIPTKTSPPKNRISTDSLPPEPLSLTEQVQKAASAKQSPTPQSPWGKVDTSMPQPFPPPPSQSPLPAPAAQRNRHNVAEALTVESRSRSETPVETPTSIAPWAKEPSEAPKGPSLKEIQELEAKKAAQREAEEAAARRAVYEKELLAQAMAPQPAPGLPTSSTWGSGQSPVTPGSAAASAWAKPLAGKPTGSTAAGAGKTLAQIQKEEEARKKMAAVAKVSTATTASSSGTAPPLSSGKRYADLAGKTAPPQPNLGGAWTTVGANGKTKTTAPPTATVAGATSRSASGGVVAASASRPKPTATPTRSATMGGAVMQANAHDEFKKWAITELRPDLKGNISVDDFVGTLMALPFDSDMITEAVHSSSQTIDSRHFAEEFIRRRKLADRGMVDPTGTSSPASATESKSGGWSEVAKKGPAAKEEPNNFKVVAAKKKGGKR